MPYATLRHDVHRATTLVAEDGARLPPEMELQSLWFGGAFGREFTTTTGKSVRIVQFGEWNHAAGPDFLHAAIELDDEKLTGPLELDPHAGDWELHGHAENPNFREVILHVVFETGHRTHFTRSCDDREIPCVVIPFELLDDALDHPLYARANSKLGRCSEPLAKLPAARVHDLLAEAARFRLTRKARHLQCLEDSHGFEEALWQSLARALGYGPNKLAMTLLGQRVPRRALRAHRTNAQREAHLFGAAGFLSPDLHEKALPDSKRYLTALWRDWWKLRTGREPDHSRTLPWKLGGMRPTNHPHRRLGALAAASAQWARLAKPAQRPSAASMERLRTRLLELEHPFWNHRYTLRSKPTARPIALCGKARVDEFLANYYISSFWRTNQDHAWATYCKLPAGTTSDSVRRATTRLFGKRPDRRQFLRKLWQHQALLQVYHDFCLEDSSDCEQCPFPEQLLRW
ncbi:MAG: DUF2851 family protein [Roseibacillus sp.]